MDYNLGPQKNCLVGNWSEEMALKDYAGHYRKPHDGPKGTSTYKRCVEHSLRYEVKDLITMNRKDFNDPKASQQNLNYNPKAMMGSREQLLLQKMHAVAAAKAPPVVAEREWTTVTQDTYTWPEVDQHYTKTLGKKNMRSLDNGPIPGRDKTFALEHRIVQPHICLENEEGKQAESPLIEQDIPITIYSANPKIHHGLSVATGINPFGKDSAFSMPISQYDRAPMKDL